MYHVRLFGEFYIEDDAGQAVKLTTRKSQLLLAYLLLYIGQPQSREKLIDLFWPESDVNKGKASVRQAIYALRKTLDDKNAAESHIITDQQNVLVREDEKFNVDAVRFEQFIKEAQRQDEKIELLEAACELYGGQLLQGCYDDWCFNLQEHYRGLYIQSLNQLIEHFREAGQYERAIDWAEQSLSADPLQEEIHRSLMLLYLAARNRAAAIKQYHECERVLDSELGVPPLPETTQLYEEIQRRSASEQIENLASTSFPSALEKLELGAPFVGRLRELGIFVQAWDEALNGRGGAVMISGEAGVGKSRLIDECALYSHQNGARIFRARAHEYESNLPYQPAAEAIRDGLTGISDKQIKALPKRVLEILSTLIPALSDITKIKSAAPLSAPEEERRRMQEALRQFFVEIAAEGPLLLLLDDLQWADESTLSWLHTLIRELDDQSLLIVGAYRVEEVGEEHPLSALIDHLQRDQLITQITLEPLNEAEIDEMLSAFFGNDVDSSVTAHILNVSNGIPFFIEELVKSLVEGHVAYQDANGTWMVASGTEPGSVIPTSIQALVKTRLRRLRRDSRQLLQQISVSAHGLSPELLVATSPGGEESFYEPIEELAQSKFLVEESGQYHFRHDLIRQVLYSDLFAEKRRQLHARMAEAIEGVYEVPQRQLQQITDLAYHYDEARRWQKALEFALQAGERIWSKNYAKDEALKFFTRALEIAEEHNNDLGRMRAYKGLGRVCATTDEQDAGLEYCERALELATEPEDRAEIYSSLASVYHNKRELEKGLEYCELALSELGEGVHSRIGAQLSQQAASFCNWIRNFDKAIEYCERALRYWNEHPDMNQQAQCLSYMGQAYSGKEEYDTALKYLSDAAKMAERIGDPLASGIAYFQLGLTYFHCNKVDIAIQSWHLALHQFTELSKPEAICSVLNNLIYGLLQLGNIQQAHINAEKQLEFAQASGRKSLIAFSHGMLGAICDALGDDEQKSYCFETALQTSPEDRTVYFHLILTYLFLDRLTEAVEWLENGFQYLTDLDVKRLRAYPNFSDTIVKFKKTELLNTTPLGNDVGLDLNK